MRAAVVTQIGSPPTVRDDHAEPTREAGTAIVRVAAAPLNPVEIRVAAGRFARKAEPPYVPGLEGAGMVVEADGMEAGTRVRFESAALPGFGEDGVMAELAAVPADSLVELPDEADEAVAAAIGVVGITAWAALERAELEEGERVLVLGATGAVGQMAVQFSNLLGAQRVVAAGRDTERLERTRAIGADEIVVLSEGRELEEIFRDAAGGGLDVVVDPLWGAPAMAALASLETGGRLVNVGESAGTEVTLPLAQIRNKQGSILTLSSGWMPLDAKARAYRQVLEHAAAGRIEVDHEVVPLDQVTEAWERQARSPGRKLVVRTTEDAVETAP
jgi:NADPH2:quinone reductase